VERDICPIAAAAGFVLKAEEGKGRGNKILVYEGNNRGTEEKG